MSGRIEAEHITELQKLLSSGTEERPIVLDLKEVQLVDRDVVAFLSQCESAGATLRNCPKYIREWISSGMY
jgi:hypothetical protein